VNPISSLLCPCRFLPGRGHGPDHRPWERLQVRGGQRHVLPPPAGGRLRREGAFSPSSAGPSRLPDLPEENKPCLKHLTENYRSHGGILRLAASVVELIHRYFPGSVDMLKGDTSPLEGPKPIFLSDSSQQGFSVSLFSQGSKDESIEFGANQANLVRDQAAKERLQSRLKMGVVLTIYEAKGMEFNAVLLYNFFHDSPAEQKWRVVLEALGERCEEAPPKFEAEKHNILSSELKHLYTAVTRARKTLVIFDASEKNRYGVQKFWEARQLVRVRKVLLAWNTDCF
jgi:hypothetical protein